MRSASLISSRVKQMGLRIDEATVIRLARFVDLVVEYRGRASLTSLRTSSDVVEELLVDSLAVSMVVGFARVRRCLDVGVGGGFPSVVVAIVSRGKTWVAVDKARRKIAFLQVIQRKLSINNYQAVCDDLRRIASDSEFASSFDLVTMRALRLDEELLQAIRSVLSEEGRVVLFRHEEGCSALHVYGGTADEAPSPREIVLGAGIRSLRFEYHGLDELTEAIR